MSASRPYVLSIAGFDPSAGAGILSDIKTFESNGVYGLGVCSALTFQNDISFEKVDWLSPENIISQIEVLSKRFDFSYVKIGLIWNLKSLEIIINFLKGLKREIKIVWDPILSASAAFEFHKEINNEALKKICAEIYLVTPNWIEVSKLVTSPNAIESANLLNDYCNVFLKGGHSGEEQANDILFSNKQQYLFKQERILNRDKHGSGCVLSSAITAELAKGRDLIKACELAKKYMTVFLKSSDNLLGFHTTNEKNHA